MSSSTFVAKQQSNNVQILINGREKSNATDGLNSSRSKLLYSSKQDLIEFSNNFDLLNKKNKKGSMQSNIDSFHLPPIQTKMTTNTNSLNKSIDNSSNGRRRMSLWPGDPSVNWNVNTQRKSSLLQSEDLFFEKVCFLLA